MNILCDGHLHLVFHSGFVKFIASFFILSYHLLSASASSSQPELPSVTPLSQSDLNFLDQLQQTSLHLRLPNSSHRAKSSLLTRSVPSLLFVSNPACLRASTPNSIIEGVNLPLAQDEVFVALSNPLSVVLQRQFMGNELLPPSPYHPWTHPPFCTPHFPTPENTKLCVYTNASFSHGRGITLLTGPKIAAHFATLPPSAQADGLHGLNENLTSLTGANWHTAVLPAKGTSLLASSYLPRGTQLLYTTPLILAYMENLLPTLARETYLQIGLSQLPLSSSRHFLSLARIYYDAALPVQDVIKANAFETSVGSTGAMHLALFPEASRMNHDCAPNAIYHLQPGRAAHSVVLTRDVEAGEELTIGYATPFHLTKDRQEYLAEAFHFTCRCKRCLRSKESDAVLRRIQELEKEMSSWAPGACPEIVKEEELLSLYGQEGLEGFMDKPLGFVALGASCRGNRERAMEFGRRAREAVGWRFGSQGQSGDWTFWSNMLEDDGKGLEKHWSWRWLYKG